MVVVAGCATLVLDLGATANDAPGAGCLADSRRAAQGSGAVRLHAVRCARHGQLGATGGGGGVAAVSVRRCHHRHGDSLRVAVYVPLFRYRFDLLFSSLLFFVACDDLCKMLCSESVRSVCFG